MGLVTVVRDALDDALRAPAEVTPGISYVDVCSCDLPSLGDGELIANPGTVHDCPCGHRWVVQWTAPRVGSVQAQWITPPTTTTGTVAGAVTESRAGA